MIFFKQVYQFRRGKIDPLSNIGIISAITSLRLHSAKRRGVDVLTLRVAANYSCHDAVASVTYMADETAYRHAGHYFALSR